VTDTASKDCAIGIDVGGTNIAGGIVDPDGQVIAHNKVKTQPKKGVDHSLEQLRSCIRDLLDGPEGGRACAIGMGIAATIDYQNNLLTLAPNIGWRDLPLPKMFTEEFGLPTFMDNDVNVGTLGEFAHGAGKGCRDVVGIFLGTGIGGGVIINGRLHRGMNGTAGEIGHMVLRKKSAPCCCGFEGCFEGLASRTAVVHTILAEKEKGTKTIIEPKKSGRVTSTMLRKAVEAGDALTIKVMEDAAEYVGLACISIVHLLCPEKVILGGGLMDVMPDFFVETANRITQERQLGHAARGVEIVRGTLGDDAGVVGGAALAMMASNYMTLRDRGAHGNEPRP